MLIFCGLNCNILIGNNLEAHFSNDRYQKIRFTICLFSIFYKQDHENRIFLLPIWVKKNHLKSSKLKRQIKRAVSNSAMRMIRPFYWSVRVTICSLRAVISFLARPCRFIDSNYYLTGLITNEKS